MYIEHQRLQNNTNTQGNAIILDYGAVGNGTTVYALGTAYQRAIVEMQLSLNKEVFPKHILSRRDGNVIQADRLEM